MRSWRDAELSAGMLDAHLQGMVAGMAAGMVAGSVEVPQLLTGVLGVGLALSVLWLYRCKAWSPGLRVPCSSAEQEC